MDGVGYASLEQPCFGEMGTLVQGHDRIEALLTRPVVLEFDALAQAEKVFLSSCLIQYVHHLRMAEPVRETFKSAIVIEEAHHILSGERQSLAGGQSVMELAFREMREFGTGLILLDQMPSTISAPSLANTYALFSFNLKSRPDVNAISQATLMEEQDKDVLGRLQIGQAVVRLQGRSTRPFMVSVPEFIIHKGVITDAHLVAHMRGLGLLFARAPVARASPGAVVHAVGSEVIGLTHTAAGPLAPAAPDTRELSLLRDVSAFSESGIAERYRRLGLSVRQGQKTKDALIEQGMIQEEVETTRFGRVRVIRLTEQGRVFLEQMSAASGSSR